MAVLSWAVTLFAVYLSAAEGFQRTFLQVIIPQRIPLHATGNLHRMTFLINIDRKSYTVHLKQQSLLTNDFRIYTYDSRGILRSSATPIKRDCYYQGYVADHTDSVVMLSTCSGLSAVLGPYGRNQALTEDMATLNSPPCDVSCAILLKMPATAAGETSGTTLPRPWPYNPEDPLQSMFSSRESLRQYNSKPPLLVTCLENHQGSPGLLQFPNISYGIEPMESAHGFQHLLYQASYGNSSSPITTDNYHIKWTTALIQKINIGVPANFSTQRYLEMHVVVAKALYEYLGSKEETVTEKIAQLINFLGAMFFKLNTKIILSSLEIWTDKDKVHTTRNMRELLQRFTEWKHSHLNLRPHDVTFLFIYRDQSDSVGSAFARKLCIRQTSAAVAVYKKGYTLENFSVIVAQLLGISLGMYFDKSRGCYCPGSACLMHTRAVQASGVKAFSSCSIKDFQSFLAHGQGQCLLNKPRLDVLYKVPTCGNGVVEDGEQCDCGADKQCIKHGCCQADCKLKPGKTCAHGPCCWERSCKIKEKGVLCRATPDLDCDLKEYCNGTSTECTEDFYVQDGQMCEGHTGVCMKGVCQSSDRWCRKVFGKDSKSGSSQCYEEINSQSDRMGHCGSSEKGYQNCQWQDLKCGKLVCEYPRNKPFLTENAAVIYARVKNRWCVTLDYQKGKGVKDPFLIHDGSGCGHNKVCMNQKCVDYATIKPTCDAVTKCNKKGVCNNKGNCHCNRGWAPPDCKTKESGGLGGSIDSTFRSASPSVKPRTISVTTRNWLLVSFCLFLPVLIGSAILIVKVRDFLLWRRDEDAKDQEEEEEEEEEEDDEYEGSREGSPTGVTSV